MNNLTFLILLFYYERPRLAIGALESIKAQTYGNYEVAFIDDSEDSHEGKALFDAWLDSSTDKYIHTADTLEQKTARGGSNFGHHANVATLASNADVIIPLCEDDRLTPWYLEELNQFYINNPTITNSYCDVIIHNPIDEDWKTLLDKRSPEHPLNTNHDRICGGNIKDSSQMSFRMSCVKEGGVIWPAPCTAALDFFVWNQLYYAYGPTYYNGIVGQVKGWGPHQLGARQNTYGATE